MKIPVALCLVSGIALGQTPPASDPMAEVRAIEARPGATWTDEDARKVAGNTSNYILGLIFGARVLQREPAMARPEVIAEIANEAVAPYVRNGKIYMPVEYFRLIEKLSYLLAHDLLLRKTDIPVGRPLLQHPVAISPLLRLMQPFKEQLAEEAFDAYVETPFRCAAPDDDCGRLRRATFASALVFVLGHELAHLYYDDSGGESSYPTDIEIRADRKAWDLLGETMKGAFTGGEREILLGMSTAALLPISYQRQLLGSQPVASSFDSRVKAIVALLPAQVRTTATYMVANREARDDTGTMRVSWTEAPDLLIVNGIEMDNSEVLNRDLLVTGDVQHVFARNGSRFAFAGVSVTRGGHESVKLEFEILKPTPREPPDEGDHDTDHPGKEWFTVFLQTSDGNMQPRNAQLAMRHWEALSELDLNQFIPATTEIKLTETEKDDLAKWRHGGVPLASWRTGQ